MSTQHVANMAYTYVEGMLTSKQTLLAWEVCVVPVDMVTRVPDNIVLNGSLQIDGTVVMDGNPSVIPSVAGQMFAWTNLGGF